MFTIDQIKAAHLRVKSGADFPNYVHDLITLGVVNYSTYVNDGHTEYFGKDNYHIQTDARYAEMHVAEKSDMERFKYRLKIHQQGQTDYPTFCNDCVETGVEKWIVDMTALTCTYFDKTGKIMLVERIPGV
jgi:uncharacterized protein YbcV (DUF1398 family)